MNMQQFSHLTDIYFDTRRNKRYGRDSMVYELSWVSNLVSDYREREDKTLRIRHNYTFLTSVPKWREIMATEFRGRLIDHEICEVVIPICEKILSPYTYNNRKGMGAQAAMNHLIDHICEVSNGYTEPCRIIKLDFKGYFPNALWDVADRCVCDAIEASGKSKEHKEYLKWLVMVSVHCNPAAHCERKSPRWLWDEYISSEKSILSKPEGVGAAIGRLIWQTAMGLYINEEIKWLTEECGIRLVCFVDDIVMVVPERLHHYALSLIPEIRKRLIKKGVRLNERKFYDQPYGHGVEFLGSHIKPMRIHLNNKTYGRAIGRCHELNNARDKVKILDKFLSSVNSYTGLLKGRTERKKLMSLKNTLSDEWWKYAQWDDARKCVTLTPNYNIKTRLNNKYHLNLKRHDKTGNRRVA